jgi:amidase
VGLKVTRDRNPNLPDGFDYALGNVVDHVVSRTVRDSAAMLDATGYAEPGSPYPAPQKSAPYLEEVSKSPGRLRIAWSAETPSGRPINPEIQAAQETRMLNRKTLAAFEHFEVFLCPVMGEPPTEIGFLDPVNLEPKEVNRRQGRVYPYTAPFNYSGQPSMSLPLAMSEAGLPLGMMFTARYGDEATLFRLAGQLEREVPWADRRPPIYG